MLRTGATALCERVLASCCADCHSGAACTTSPTTTMAGLASCSRCTHATSPPSVHTACLCASVWALLMAAQLAGSRWWLARYQFGPAEWLWRSLTYGRRQPLRRPAAATS